MGHSFLILLRTDCLHKVVHRFFIQTMTREIPNMDPLNNIKQSKTCSHISPRRSLRGRRSAHKVERIWVSFWDNVWHSQAQHRSKRQIRATKNSRANQLRVPSCNQRVAKQSKFRASQCFNGWAGFAKCKPFSLDTQLVAA